MNDDIGFEPLYDQELYADPDRADCRALLRRALAVLERFERVPDRPAHERALVWLDGICGGRGAVLALTAEPLQEPDMPTGTGADQQRLVATADLLDACASRLFDEEAGVAFLRALALVWRDEPSVVRGARSAATLAAGVLWVVGEANGLVGHQRVTSRQVRDALALGRSAATYADPVRDALRGMWRWDDDWDPSGWRYTSPSGWRPHLTSLAPLGHADLLVSATRERLLRVRDRALAAQETAWTAA